MARGDVLTPIARVAKAPELRRVHLAFTVFSISEHATWLAVLFYALQRGGPKEVGIVAVVQLVPGVLSTPFSSYAGDRFDPRRALAVGYAVQSATMAATAVAMTMGAWLPAYGFAAAAATAISFTRPVMGSLLPSLTHSPADLVAANVVAGIIEQIGVFLGPIAAGVLMAATSPATVFAAAASCTAFGCLVTLGLRGGPDERPRDALPFTAVVGELFGGFRAVRGTPVIGVFLVLLVCGGLVKGIGDVVFVTFADIRLDGTAGQSGLLAGAYGLGGLFGAMSVTRLVQGRPVERQLLAVAAVLGASLLGLAAAGTVVPALVAFAMLGGAESALVLSSTVSIQRVAPADVLARVFGIVEAVQMACIALGSLAITVLVATTSLGHAFAVLAAVLVLVVGIGVVRLRRHADAIAPVDPALVERVLADPLFASLPAPTVERLARGLHRFTVPAGTDVVVAGGVGDRFYLVADGELRVTRDGQVLNTLDRTRSFGELALLRDVPRAATVTAVTDAELYALDREPFLEAVTGHSRSLAAANRLLDTIG